MGGLISLIDKIFGRFTGFILGVYGANYSAIEDSY
jgi:hypothetical protein